MKKKLLEVYCKMVVCTNCGDKINCEIPKGESIDCFCKKTKCSTCGCFLKIDSGYWNPYYINPGGTVTNSPDSFTLTTDNVTLIT